MMGSQLRFNIWQVNEELFADYDSQHEPSESDGEDEAEDGDYEPDSDAGESATVLDTDNK